MTAVVQKRCSVKTVLIRLITSAVILLGFGISPASAQSAPALVVPPVPATLEVPAGNTLYFGARAVGTQNYVCLTMAKRTVGWRFIGPQATLFVDGGGGVQQQITTHFLSVNPSEVNVARPVWQHSIDTSKVWGRVRSSSADPQYVAPGAIPWLLLEVAGTQLGPNGGGTMAGITFIHRVNTSGGVAPSTGCTNDDEIGKVALVPYTTDYFFYRKSQN
jgi:Protein of unknown function (DUF3455)